MNFINHETEPMPPGAAQSTEQPTVEKSIADALAARVERLEKENAALRELVERQQLGLDEAYKLMPYMYQYVTNETGEVVRLWLDNYEAMKRGAK